MSVSNIIVPGGLQKPACVRLTTTTITDIYTATDNLDTVVAIVGVDETNAAVDALIDWFDGTTNNHICCLTISSGTKGHSIFDVPIRLLTGHKIRATASAANQITVSVYVTKSQRSA
jgi:hypothetical protein